jgi:predicted TPR repeat methyltransferase
MSDRQSDLEKGRAYAQDERLSAFYERHLLDECRYRAHERVADSVASLARGGSRWLDVGAGTGLVGRALETIGADVVLVALDISSAMLDRIECELYVDRTQGDCRQPLPWSDETFDGAFSCGLLEHVDDAATMFRELARLLKRGAPLIFTFPPSDAPAVQGEGLVAHDESNLRRQLEASGFAWLEQRDWPAYRDVRAGWVAYRHVRAERA